jgi:hypothetical protein
MSENLGQVKVRLRQSLGAGFAALAADSGFLAAQGVVFVLDDPGKTPDPVLYHADLRGAQNNPERPAATIADLTFPVIRDTPGGCLVYLVGQLTCYIFTGVAPETANVNANMIRTLIIEALASISGVEIDTPADVVQNDATGAQEGDFVLVQPFRMEFTMSGGKLL